MAAQRITKLVELNYTLTRPFPHSRKLFIGLVLGAVVLSTLFGFVAVATDAYVVQSVYTSDPNTTESHIQWFQKAPFSWLGSLKTTCQDSMLSPAGSFMTTNQGFVYTLEQIWTGDGNAHQRLPQAFYHNSTLRNCEVLEIDYRLTREVQQDNQGQWWTWSASTASAMIQCDLDTAFAGTVHVAFSVSLPRVGLLRATITAFLTQENGGLKSMWYVVRLTDGWYYQVAATMAYIRPDTGADDHFSAGGITLRRNEAVTDWHSPDFFLVRCEFTTLQGWNAHYTDDNMTIAGWQGQQGQDLELPMIYESVDAFGKSFYSLLAVDFGMNNVSNPLLSQNGVRHFRDLNNTLAAEAFVNCNKTLPIGFCASGQVPQFEIDDSVDLSEVPASRLVTQYLCSVPQQKSSISVSYAVILAILVFVSSLWKLSTMLLQWCFVSGKEGSSHCVGCAKAGQDVEMGDRPTMSTYSSTSLCNTAYSPGDEHDHLLRRAK